MTLGGKWRTMGLPEGEGSPMKTRREATLSDPGQRAAVCPVTRCSQGSSVASVALSPSSTTLATRPRSSSTPSARRVLPLAWFQSGAARSCVGADAPSDRPRRALGESVPRTLSAALSLKCQPVLGAVFLASVTHKTGGTGLFCSQPRRARARRHMSAFGRPPTGGN